MTTTRVPPRRLPWAIASLSLAFLWPSPAPAETPEDKGRAIADELRRRHRGFQDSAARVQMTLRDREGNTKTRELRVQVLEGAKDGDKTLVTFVSPADVAGTAALTHIHERGPDEQWLYLPVLKRVKPIKAQDQSSSFMGSEFSFEDLAGGDVGEYRHEWLRDEPCAVEGYRSLRCFVVERRPRGEDSAYSRQVVWVDQDEYRELKIDYYDREGALAKTLTLIDYRKVGDHWRPHTTSMEDHRSKRRTDLTWRDYRFGTGLSDEDFAPQTLAGTG